MIITLENIWAYLNLFIFTGVERFKFKMMEYRGLLEQWKPLYDTVSMDSCHYTVVQTHGMYSTKNDS